VARCARRWITELEKERDARLVKIHPLPVIDGETGEWMSRGRSPERQRSIIYPHAKRNVEQGLAIGPNDGEALVAALLFEDRTGNTNRALQYAIRAASLPVAAAAIARAFMRDTRTPPMLQQASVLRAGQTAVHMGMPGRGAHGGG
jgi:hypothetical protein